MLSAYTHIWNPIGFPVLRPDEGAYMRRAMHVLEGLGPQDPASRFDHSQDSTSSYDHPYFGQLFLGGILKLIGYPGSIINPSSFSSSSTISSSPNSIQHSIEMLYLVPRMLMGILAVIDTFLIYKICEHRYNRSVAFIASILFAVMPMTWILRLIVLDSIQLPFLLCSILFATYYPIKKSNFAKSNIENSDNTDATYRKQFMLILLSGIFLGLAIFTKLPAITVIPMVAFLIYTNNSKKNNKNKNNNLKKVGLWFIPVILIPLIWPVYSISVGHFNEWLNGVMWQATERHGGKTLPDIIISFFRIDPLLLVLGTAGIVISALAIAATSPKTKDFLFLVLWSSPYLLLIYFVGWAIIFYLIPLLPIFCIAAAWLLEYLVNRIASSDKIRITKKKNTEQQEDVLIQQKLFLVPSSLSPLSFAIILVTAIFVIFGLLTSSILITTNISLSQFEAAAFVGYDIQHNSYASSSNNNNNSNNKSANGGGGDDDITIISSPAYSWIFNYVFHESHVFSHDRDTQPIETKKILLIVDGTYKRVLSKVEGEDEKQVTRLEKLYNSTDTITTYDDDTTRYVHNEYNNYPYASMNENRIGGGGIEVKANY